MPDKAISAIEQRGSRTTFEWFRHNFMVDHDSRDRLNWGHAVIDSELLLDQYLYSYGPMIESQWACVVPHLDGIEPPNRLIDYGCGQGLAGLLLNDLSTGALLAHATEVVLIEPSAPALARARTVYAAIMPRASIGAVGKRFDDLAEDDVSAESVDQTLHIFSNTLDVPGYDALALLAKTLRLGRHTIVAVSHDREFNGGTPRIKEVKAAFEALASELNITRSTIEQFQCDNPGRSEGVVWICEFGVDDG